MHTSRPSNGSHAPRSQSVPWLHWFSSALVARPMQKKALVTFPHTCSQLQLLRHPICSMHGLVKPSRSQSHSSAGQLTASHTSTDVKVNSKVAQASGSSKVTVCPFGGVVSPGEVVLPPVSREQDAPIIKTQRQITAAHPHPINPPRIRVIRDTLTQNAPNQQTQPKPSLEQNSEPRSRYPL